MDQSRPNIYEKPLWPQTRNVRTYSKDIWSVSSLGGVVHIEGFPFTVTDWAGVPRTEHRGETGIAYWRTQKFGDIRVRMVEYSSGYLADHWCVKGHLVYCVSGELHTELKDGRRSVLTPGMTYQVADNSEPHRSFSPHGATLFIVD